MSMRINGEQITEVVYEWAVRWPENDDGLPAITAVESESDARIMANEIKGIPLVKTIYITDWLELQPIGAKVLCKS